MERKRRLFGRREVIIKDLMWRERRMRWKLRVMAKREEGRGRRVCIRNRWIRIEDQWWRRDEEEEVLKNGWNKVKEEAHGEN